MTKGEFVNRCIEMKPGTMALLVPSEFKGLPEEEKDKEVYDMIKEARGRRPGPWYNLKYTRRGDIVDFTCHPDPVLPKGPHRPQSSQYA